MPQTQYRHPDLSVNLPRPARKSRVHIAPPPGAGHIDKENPLPPGPALYVRDSSASAVTLPARYLEDIDQMELATVKRIRERLIYLVSLVTDPHHCLAEHDYSRHLSSQVLDEVCGVRLRRKCYRDLLAALEAAGLVEIDGSYSTGLGGRAGYSKSYRCPRPWQGERRIVMGLETVDLTRYQETPAMAAAQTDDAGVAYLATCYQRSDLDVRQAVSLLCAEHRLSPELERGELDSAHHARLSAALDGNGAGQWALESIWRGWVVGRGWFKRDTTAGRLHSPVTSLPEYLRPALRLAGDARLVSLDLKCSQLVFAAGWMIADGLGATDSGARWLHIAQTGDLYNETHRVVHGRLPTTEAERKEWKTTLFKLWWYARRQVQEHNPVGAKLAAAFPDVHAWILARKVTVHDGGTGYRGYPIELQRREAAVFIDDLSLRLQAAGVLALTIHDSLVVREADATVAETLMREALASLGVRVQIKPELYCAALDIAA